MRILPMSFLFTSKTLKHRTMNPSNINRLYCDLFPSFCQVAAFVAPKCKPECFSILNKYLIAQHIERRSYSKLTSLADQTTKGLYDMMLIYEQYIRTVLFIIDKNALFNKSKQSIDIQQVPTIPTNCHKLHFKPIGCSRMQCRPERSSYTYQ